MSYSGNVWLGGSASGSNIHFDWQPTKQAEDPALLIAKVGFIPGFFIAHFSCFAFFRSHQLDFDCRETSYLREICGSCNLLSKATTQGLLRLLRYVSPCAFHSRSIYPERREMLTGEVRKDTVQKRKKAANKIITFSP